MAVTIYVAIPSHGGIAEEGIVTTDMEERDKTVAQWIDPEEGPYSDPEADSVYGYSIVVTQGEYHWEVQASELIDFGPTNGSEIPMPVCPECRNAIATLVVKTISERGVQHRSYGYNYDHTERRLVYAPTPDQAEQYVGPFGTKVPLTVLRCNCGFCSAVIDPACYRFAPNDYFGDLLALDPEVRIAPATGEGTPR